MNREIRILHLEDTATDAELIATELKRGNVRFVRLVVDNKKAFIAALKEFVPDIILSDHSLPMFDSFEALSIVQKAGIRVPFILITATISEEVAVDLMKHGAWDYMLKDRLQRLPNAIWGAMEKYRLQEEKQAYIDKVIASEALFQEAEKIAHFGIWSVNLETRITIWSDETFRILGYEPGEIDPSGESFLKTIHENDIEEVTKIINDSLEGEGSRTMDFRIKNKGNCPKYVRSAFLVHRHEDGKPKGITGFNFDVTEQKLAEQVLQQSEANLRTVFDNTENGYALLDTNMQIISCNHILYEWSKIDLLTPLEVGTNFMDHLPKDRLENTKIAVAKVLMGQTVEYDTQFNQKDGSITFYCISYLPVLNEKGKVLGLTLSVMNITERKKNELAILESEERYRLVTDNPLLGVTWGSLKGEVLYANETFSRMLGYTADEIKGINFADITHPDDLVSERPIFRKISSGEISNYRIEKRFITKQKESIWVDQNLNRVKNQAGEEYIIGIIQDITLRKTAELEVKVLNESLEQKVLERTARLEEANKDLEAFNYMVSHDLRNPLLAIEMFQALILRQTNNIIDPLLDKYISNIKECTSEMNELINSLLELSRTGKEIDALEMKLVYVNMEELIGETFDALKSLENEKDIQLVVVNALPIIADKTLMKLVITNLLSNAIKYSSKQNQIKITIEGCNKGKFIEYSIKDNGAGFDMENIDKLFKPFSRLHSDDDFKGTGAGLSIVEKVIHFHQGKVSAYSNVGEGATFTFSIPIRSDEENN